MIFPKNYSYKPPKKLTLDWDSFSKGLNTFLQESEIQPDELAQATNLMLTGKGRPTKRWGTGLYFQANATGSVRGLKGFYKSDNTNELLALTDEGYLSKRSGASWASINGASWASGNDVTMAQLNNTMYIMDGNRALTKYSSPTLVGFATLATPTITGATNLSNASGTTIKSYRISTISNVGETLASNSFTLANQPDTLGGLSGGTIRLFYSVASNASIAVGVNIYGRDQGYERFIASQPIGATTFDDDGSSTPSDFSFPPTADSTGGPVGKYIKRFQDRLIIAGLTGEPSKVLISGRSPYHERFDLSFGGNFINIEQDAGDNITGIESFRDRIIVFKQKSIWQITLGVEQIGNFFITTPSLQLITASYGCIAPKSIVAVENDIYFLSAEGVNTLGYQSGYAIDTLRTSSISTKVRPFFDALTTDQKEGATATYFNKKYIIAIPGKNQSMMLDVERGAWMGPWTRDANIFEVYLDSNGDKHLLYGNDDSPLVDEYLSSATDDKGSAIQTALKTRQEDFGEFTLFKFLKDIFMQYRNVSGNINVAVRIENKDGTVTSGAIGDFNVSSFLGTSGFGADLWGQAVWGTSTQTVTTKSTQQFIKWIKLYKTARTIQFSITTNNVTDNYELLGLHVEGNILGNLNRQSSWKT